MTLGTGIFLSALFLGFVILFVASKDKSKWKKGFKVCLIVVGFTAVAIGGYLVSVRKQIEKGDRLLFDSKAQKVACPLFDYPESEDEFI